MKGGGRGEGRENEGGRERGREGGRGWKGRVVGKTVLIRSVQNMLAYCQTEVMTT